MNHRTIVPTLALFVLGLSLGVGAFSCGRDGDQSARSRRAAPAPDPRSSSVTTREVARRYDEFQTSRKTPGASSRATEPNGERAESATTLPAPARTPLPRRERRGVVNPALIDERISDRAAPTEAAPQKTAALSEDVVVQTLVHDPARPGPGDSVAVRASIRSAAPLESATLHYHAGPGEATVPLELEPVQPAANGGDENRIRRYTARLDGFAEGTLVRYWITMRDQDGGQGRYPAEDNPTRAFGLYVEGSSIDTKLPVYHLFLSPSRLATLNSDPFSDTYQRGDFVHDGKVYCDVGIRYRGQTSRRYPKRQWKIKFNADHHFISPTPGRMEIGSINLKSAYVDKIYIRETLGFELFRELGEPYCETEFIRTYLNGDLLGLYLHVENPGGTYLKRNGLDENGFLWKAYGEGHGEGQSRDRGSSFFGPSRESRLARPTGYGGIGRFELEAGDPEKGSRLLEEFLQNINRLTGEALEDYLREKVDVDSMVNYLVASQLIHNCDHVMKNYLVYADSKGRFRYLAWDLDLTHGRNYECGPGILNDTIRHDMWDREWDDDALLYGTLVHQKCDGFWNALVNAFIGRAKAFRPLYYERLAECLERYYRPDVLIPKAERLRDRIREEVRLDRARWGSYQGEQDFDRRFRRFLDWVPKRYDHLRSKLRGLGYDVK